MTTKENKTETSAGKMTSGTMVIPATPTSVTTASGAEVSSGGATPMTGTTMSGPKVLSPRILNAAAEAMVLSGATVSVKTLLDAGAHFGHQTQRWSPRMSPYIFGDRNGIHIINLDSTMKLWERARKFVVDTVAAGGAVMFVGTKQQCREIIQEEATRCGAFFVTDRWLGGTLSNFKTIRSAIERMNKLEELVKSAEQENSKVRIVKKERVRIHKELDKLQKSLGGIREMRKMPQVVFIIDLVKEEIAVLECRKLNIPVVGIADTNSDPSKIAFPIPSNDDAPKVCRLLAAAIADAVIEGKRMAQHDGNAHSGGHSHGGGSSTPRGRRAPNASGNRNRDRREDRKEDRKEEAAAPETPAAEVAPV